MTNCIFCKIVNGEIPCDKVYEDDNFLVFLDINPVNKGHTLVISKKHYDNFLETPDDLLEKIVVVLKKVGKSVKEAMGVEGFNLCANIGRISGQIVDHVHFHIIPRIKDDGLKHWPGKKYKEGEAKEISKKIRRFL